MKVNITVTKLPHSVDSKQIDNVQSFAHLPRLYLELLENKQKIQREKIGTEFVVDRTNLPDIKNIGSIKEQKTTIEKFTKNNMSESDNQEYNYHEDDLDSYGTDNSIDDYDVGSVVSSLNDEDQNSVNNIVSSRLDELTDDNDDTVASVSSSVSSNKYSRKRNRKGYSISHRDHRKSKNPGNITSTAPSLRDLEVNDKSDNFTNLDNEAATDTNDDLKREILFKFELLKRSYPKSDVPTYTIHTDYNTMVTSYNECLRMLSLDSSVENYKQYLTYGFMGCEFIFGKFFKLDMEGFTQQQILSMSSYEKLLIELGEKSYVPQESKWPVEVRLLILIIVNAAFFLVSKIIMKKTGDSISKMMNNIKPSKPESNPKMKGPADIDDLFNE